VRVNGKKVVDFNTMVDLEQDKLVVDGYKAEPLVLDYIIMNKPKGVVTTCFDDQGRKIVLDLLPPELRHLKPVGRLDTDSEGLLLLTNDGNLAKALTHPSHDVPKFTKSLSKAKSLLNTLKHSHQRAVVRRCYARGKSKQISQIHLNQHSESRYLKGETGKTGACALRWDYR
jgi:16S rRNA U516 pseudouridylate synthase RsuA-like enzyme